jgi:hypothetical protein
MTEDAQRFLEDGVRFYRQSLQALAYFEDLVQRAGSAAFSLRSEELSQINVVYSSEVAPLTAVYKGPPPWLGVQVACAPPLKKLYIGLCWDLREDGAERPTACVNFETASAPTRELLLTAIGKVPPAPPYKIDNPQGNEAGMSVEIRAEDAGRITEILGGMLSEWARLLREIGGINVLTTAIM